MPIGAIYLSLPLASGRPVYSLHTTVYYRSVNQRVVQASGYDTGTKEFLEPRPATLIRIELKEIGLELKAGALYPFLEA